MIVIRLLDALLVMFAMRDRDLPAPLDAREIHRILVVRLDNIGDMVMSLPALRALRDSFPKVEIDLVAQETVRPLLDGCPWIDNVYTVSLPAMASGRVRASSMREWLALLRNLRSCRYDLAIDLRGDNYARALLVLCRAPMRVGFARAMLESLRLPTFGRYLTHRVPVATELRHTVEDNLAIANAAIEALGLQPVSAPSCYWDNEARDNIVRDKLVGLGVIAPYCVVQTTTNDPGRMWGVAEWGGVVDHLAAKGLWVVLTGGPSEIAKIDAVRTEAGHQDRVVNAAGVFTLSEMFSLFRKASLAVSVDTGPMHIAAAAEVPCIALMLPYFSAEHYPYGQRDSAIVAPTTMPLHEFAFGRHEGGVRPLLSITPEMVIGAIDVRVQEAGAL